MHRLVTVAFASALLIIASSDAFARGGHGGGFAARGSHFGGNFSGRFHNFSGRFHGGNSRFHGGNIRAGSFGGVRTGHASDFRSHHSLQGARVLNRHLDHHNRFNNQLLIYGGYSSYCHPVWNGYAWASNCNLDY
jgi:hypothetical protein